MFSTWPYFVSNMKCVRFRGFTCNFTGVPLPPQVVSWFMEKQPPATVDVVAQRRRLAAPQRGPCSPRAQARMILKTGRACFRYSWLTHSACACACPQETTQRRFSPYGPRQCAHPHNVASRSAKRISRRTGAAADRGHACVMRLGSAVHRTRPVCG